MSGLGHEILVALRLLRQSPGLAAATVLTLALGIGANATIYSFADAILFRPLAVPDADRLVHVLEQRQSPGNYPLSYADYPYYRDHARSFDAIAAHYPSAPLHVLIDGDSQSINGAVVTASYFDVLQLRPADDVFLNDSRTFVRVTGEPALMMSPSGGQSRPWMRVCRSPRRIRSAIVSPTSSSQCAWLATC